MPLVQLFFDLQNKCLVRGFNNSIQSSFPNCFQGDTLTLQMRFMNPTGNQTVPYVDVDESAAFVQTAIGTIAGLPTAGTFTITDSTATQTTAAIPFNASAGTVQTAIQTSLTTNWSSATVVGSAGGPWTITNGANGAHATTLVIVGTDLVPASQGLVEVQAPGGASTPAVQWFKLMLSPVAYQDSWTAYPAPAVAISNIQTGGVSSSNSIQGITLNNQPYAGTFTVTFGGQTTAPLPYNATTAQVQTALQALTSIGAGNCSVGGIIGAYVVTFIGSLGGAAQAAFTASATGLTGPLMLTGTLSMATVGIEEAVGQAQNINQTFEVNITPSGGAAQTILQTGVQIGNDLIPNAPAIPTPTAVYLLSSNNLSDVASLPTSLQNLLNSLSTTQGTILYRGASSWAALAPGTAAQLLESGGASANPAWGTPAWFNSNPTALSISAAGSSTVARGASTTLQFLTAGAGSGTYTYSLTLGTSGAVRGDRMELNISLPASTNPTIDIIGASTQAVAGTGSAFNSYLVYWFNGTSWDLQFRSA